MLTTSPTVVSSSDLLLGMLELLKSGNFVSKLISLFCSSGHENIEGGGGKLGLLLGGAVGSRNEAAGFEEEEFKGKATLLFNTFFFGDLVNSILSLYENFGGSFHPASVRVEVKNVSY